MPVLSVGRLFFMSLLLRIMYFKSVKQKNLPDISGSDRSWFGWVKRWTLLPGWPSSRNPQLAD